MPDNIAIANSLLRGNAAPPNFVASEEQAPAVDEFAEIIPALGKIRGSFKVNEGAFVPPSEIPSYNLSTSYRSTTGGDNQHVMTRNDGGKATGVTDGRSNPMTAFVQPISNAAVSNLGPMDGAAPSAIDEFRAVASFAAPPLPAEVERPAPMPGDFQGQSVVEQPYPVPEGEAVFSDEDELEEDELAALESELANMRMLGSQNRSRVQDLIFS